MFGFTTKESKKLHLQFGQTNRKCSFNDCLLTYINHICIKHKCATSMCHCTNDMLHVLEVHFPYGTRVPRKTALNKWKQLIRHATEQKRRKLSKNL